MNLCRLVYISDSARQMQTEEVANLVNHCRESNKARGVGGILLYSGGHFMQLLEGPGMQISSLFARISLDPRHTDVRQLLYRDAHERIFPEWGMQLANTEQSLSLDRDRIDKVLLRMRLKQTEDQVDEAVSLLREFRGQVMGSKVA